MSGRIFPTPTPILAMTLTLALTLTLAGCGSRKQTTREVATSFGPATATGTISATGSSLYRRGTHLLLVSGRPRLFLESRTVDLNRYRDVHAAVSGTLSPNTHERFLPVLTVESVRILEEQAPAPFQRYSTEAMGFSFEAPRSWQQSIEGGSVTFKLPSEAAPFIRIAAANVPFPADGLRVRVGGLNGVRIVDASGVHNVFVERAGGDILLFTFAPKGEESALLRDAFYTMLRSVRFEEDKEDKEDKDDGYAGSLQPCGGPAGVVCPAGEYCEVKELDTGIGRCRKLL